MADAHNEQVLELLASLESSLRGTLSAVLRLRQIIEAAAVEPDPDTVQGALEAQRVQRRGHAANDFASLWDER